MSDDEEKTASDDAVLSKYMEASEITNDTLQKVLEKCVEGASVVEICEFGDKYVTEEVNKIHKKNKEMKKGIAFPTCLSVNNCVSHMSPLRSDPPILLKSGDMVKVELGAQIDGYATFVAHTLVIGASQTNPVTGRKADVILAAYQAAEAAVRQLKPGVENIAIAETMTKVCEAYDCRAVEGCTSHQLKRFEPDLEANKRIVLNPSEAARKELETEKFEESDVVALDVLVSTGEGKPKETEVRTTVYRKLDAIYNLKMKTSRQLLADVEKRYAVFGFSLRSFDEENQAKLGVLEPVKHAIMLPFPVTWEKEGEFVARFLYTAVMHPNGTLRVTSGSFDPTHYKSERHLDNPAITSLLATPLRKVGGKKRNKKKDTSTSAASGAAGANAAPAASKAASDPANATPNAAASAPGSGTEAKATEGSAN